MGSTVWFNFFKYFAIKDRGEIKIVTKKEMIKKWSSRYKIYKGQIHILSESYGGNQLRFYCQWHNRYHYHGIGGSNTGEGGRVSHCHHKLSIFNNQTEYILIPEARSRYFYNLGGEVSFDDPNLCFGCGSISSKTFCKLECEMEYKKKGQDQ